MIKKATTTNLLYKEIRKKMLCKVMMMTVKDPHFSCTLTANFKNLNITARRFMQKLYGLDKKGDW